MIRKEKDPRYYSSSEISDDIHKMWKINAIDRDGLAIKTRIENLIKAHDLTMDEWYAWARHCAKYEA